MSSADNPENGNPENPDDVAAELIAEAEAVLAAEGEDAATADSSAGSPDAATELKADLQRVSAEFANYRKRTAREVVDARVAGKNAVIEQLLVVLDDLDRARSHGDLEAGPLKSVADKLDGVFKGLGLEAFGAEGDEFDPAIHEAVQHEGDGAEPVLGTVLRPGYRVGDNVIRGAMVVVVDRPEGDDSDNTDQDGKS